jgi:hypothetical protein
MASLVGRWFVVLYVAANAGSLLSSGCSSSDSRATGAGSGGAVSETGGAGGNSGRVGTGGTPAAGGAIGSGASGSGATGGQKAGTGGTSPHGGTSGSADAGGPDSSPGDAADAQATSDASCADGAAITGSLEGVWTGTQGGETFTATIGNGCAIFEGTAAGTLCDYCAGTYAIVDATHASATIACTPRSACSTSPAHTDVGTLTRSRCSLNYTYNFGSGNGVWTGNRVSDVQVDVCSQADGGH